MKINKISNIFTWFAASALLLTTACSDDTFAGLDNGASDEVTVTFNLAPEGLSAVSRSDDGLEFVDYDNDHISDGTKADMLIYAVYDENDQLLMGYSAGSRVPGFDHGDGQTIIPVDKFPCTVNLILKKNAKYKIAFWAQSQKTAAFNTADLRKVEVIYNQVSSGPETVQTGNTSGSNPKSGTPNNDEFRDAFCRSIELTTGSNNTLEQNVYLYRPFSQINVGTSGFDYEIITRDAIKKYTYSKIRINRVARYLDVVNDKVLTSTTSSDNDANTPEAFAVIDFDYAPIPAYYKYNSEYPSEAPDQMPEYPSYSKWDWDYNNDAFQPKEQIDKDTYNYEEFLKVHLDGRYENKGTEGYTGDTDNDGYLDYANYNDYPDALSETFKYLSMCYVLTASTKEDATVINNVKVWLATDADGSDEVEILNIDHVPAQRNWRTNIIGNLLTEQTTFDVKLDTDFAGEFNGVGNDNWEFSGPLAQGVYYDGKNDVIEISDAQGLLWFQQMVNGKMFVREDYPTNNGIEGAKKGSNYIYYGDKEFKYSGIQKPSDPVMLKRILRATHQEFNSSNGQDADKWPGNGNFHFNGKPQPDLGLGKQATVKLVADIDLSGIDWIPIGFDGRILETVNRDFKMGVGENRGFYGIFDGNGHTIYNLSTKRFGAEIHQSYHERTTNNDLRYVDNLQWFGRGLFGEIGGSAVIENVTLYNVDIYGCHGVGGIVGIAYGDDVVIRNCVVDGGSIIVTPLYRCDDIQTSGATRGQEKQRTFARGVYLGGIVGYFNTTAGKVIDCEVRNIYMRGYRRIGGLIGSLDLSKDNSETADAGTNNSVSKPDSIVNNRIYNTTIIASQFSTFGMRHEYTSRDFYKTGFGWDPGQYDLYAQEFIGGDSKDFVNKNIAGSICYGNVAAGLTFSEFTETLTDKNVRVATLQGAPLKYMPILSSWFADDITLYSNYYGAPSAKKEIMTNSWNVPIWPVGYDTSIKSSKSKTYKFPMAVPADVEITWNPSSPNVGLYVESVTLTGNGLGGRSVITPEQVSGEGSCTMLVTARDRAQYQGGPLVNEEGGLGYIQQPTTLKNLVLRGSPYAYTGLLISPNENMGNVTLDNVAIYDVYQTIALDSQTDWNIYEYDSSYGKQGQSGKMVEIDLVVKNSNLRGYTVPGAGWRQVSYTGTTFEQGGATGHGNNELTYKVESPTSFTGCFFKAPYIIDLSVYDGDLTEIQNNVTFEGCKGTATGFPNADIELTGKDGLKFIYVTRDEQGTPVVEYYRGANDKI